MWSPSGLSHLPLQTEATYSFFAYLKLSSITATVLHQKLKAWYQQEKEYLWNLQVRS